VNRAHLILAILVVALVAGIVGSAHAEEIRPTRANFDIALQVKYLPQRQAWDYCKSLGMWPGVHAMPRRPVGCNLFYPDKKLCVIVTPAPMEVDDDATLNLGHEVDHCLRGDYHR
jgi:hypothetical protein